MRPAGIHMICVPCFHMQSVTAGDNKKQLTGEISHKHKNMMSCTPFKYKSYIYGSCFSECCWRESWTHPGLSSEGLGRSSSERLGCAPGWRATMRRRSEDSVRRRRFISHLCSSTVAPFLLKSFFIHSWPAKHKFTWQERSQQMFNTMKNIYLTFYHHCCWRLNHFKLFSVQGTCLIFRWMPLCLC